MMFYQCCGSRSVGTVFFGRGMDRIRESEVRIRIRIQIPLSSSNSSKKNSDSYCFVTSFVFEKLCKCTHLQKGNKQKSFLLASWSSMKIAGAGAGSVPYQNVTDPQPSNIPQRWVLALLWSLIFCKRCKRRKRHKFSMVPGPSLKGQ